jgi:hypothetical protein
MATLSTDAPITPLRQRMQHDMLMRGLGPHTHHPHVHMIVPGGGIAPDGSRWISSRPAFLRRLAPSTLGAQKVSIRAISSMPGNCSTDFDTYKLHGPEIVPSRLPSFR